MLEKKPCLARKNTSIKLSVTEKNCLCCSSVWYFNRNRGFYRYGTRSTGDGTWSSGQRVVITCRRSQVRAPTMAMCQPFVLTCWWMREVAVRERSLWLPVCCVTQVTHPAIIAYSRPVGLCMRYRKLTSFFNSAPPEPQVFNKKERVCLLECEIARYGMYGADDDLCHQLHHTLPRDGDPPVFHAVVHSEQLPHKTETQSQWITTVMDKNGGKGTWQMFTYSIVC
jgi:hypothetical protein